MPDTLELHSQRRILTEAVCLLETGGSTSGSASAYSLSERLTSCRLCALRSESLR
jgi:hypothetical protein